MKYLLWLLLLTSYTVYATAECNSDKHSVKDCNSIENTGPEDTNLDTIFKNIAKLSSDLKTFESNLSYLIIQDPEIVDSRTLQTGKLYYQKEDDVSRLRIRFDQLKQDDFPPEEYIEDYYFDGVWLTKVNYKLEQVNLYQQAPENEPVDVFELINDRFPLIGLSGAETIKKDFEVSVVSTSSTDPNELIQLLLKTKKDSRYLEDYKKVDFWLYKSSYLPARVMAYSTQGDVYDVRFSDIAINKKLKNGVFKVETPAGFRENIQALETDQ